jgi:hypothetical protein
MKKMKLKSIKIAVNTTEAVVRKLKTAIPLRQDTELHEIIRKHVDALMLELIEQHADLPTPPVRFGGTP